MKKYLFYFTLISSGLYFSACHTNKSDAGAPVEEIPEATTPVTVVSIARGQMEDFVDLNATSSFRQKWILRSNLNGYLQNSNVQLNKLVNKGQSLFSVKTKEAVSIGNTINILDSSFKFNGVNSIKSNGAGFISEINHQSGDYVQDGEQLAVVTDTKSFVFLLDLPYEMRPYILGKPSLPLILPDGEKMIAFVSGIMPAMDSVSQTQRVILKVNTSHQIPENLIAKVRLAKHSSSNATYLPKAAILSDETQTNFWVMKLIDDSTAAKTIIKKGIESGGNIEILSPIFTLQDKILVTGNYALPDTAKVKVITQ